MDETPDFGPRGYLPERASKRARKIVLRAPMGLQWVLGAAAFGAVLLIAGLLWLHSAGPPGAPYVATVRLEAGAPVTVTRVAAVDAWVVTGAGPPLAVPANEAGRLRWCDTSRRLQAGDGRTWTATGRGLSTASLSTRPVVVYDGTVYVDPTVERAGVRPLDEPATAAC